MNKLKTVGISLGMINCAFQLTTEQWIDIIFILISILGIIQSYLENKEAIKHTIYTGGKQ